MAKARSIQQWDHTSQILSFLANGLLRGKSQPAYRAEQFHPYRQASGPQVLKLSKKEGMTTLRRLIEGRN